MHTEEHKRLEKQDDKLVHPWHKWGPYVSERSWGTVREDYSWNGDAWHYFPFDQAHIKAYRWGEDAIAGWCDRYQVLLFSPVFWNGKDPILKERLFGLSSPEGNHGEDVKECYYYLDGIPSHAYMRYLYKYPQGEFPYQLLKEVNAKRSTLEPEYELVDTKIFAENRYFDIFVEYAKASPEDLCIRIEAFNRSSQDAPLHILPHLWFRNQWSFGDVPLTEPKIEQDTSNPSYSCFVANDEKLLSPVNLSFDYHLGKRYLYGPPGGELLFTNNESPHEGQKYSKEAFHKSIIHQDKTAVNPEHYGTKACMHYTFNVKAGSSVVLYLRLTDRPMQKPLDDIDSILAKRKEEADTFYEAIHPKNASLEEKQIQRQSLAGMLWNKQIYLFDVEKWFTGDNSFARPPTSRYNIRNDHWRHLNSMRILLMPDKWEYPWFASWDLAFQTVTMGLIDIEYAKEQLWLLLFDQFQHPNGAIPAYEWEFSDLNPPIQAWAALRLYHMEKEQTGKTDKEFLKRCFLKLLINFAWWVNKVDTSGYNVFEGGFLGLDNITLIDRSKEFEGGATLRQSDGTGWMAMFCLNLMRMALELSKEDRTYEAMATKFFEHFVYIAHAMKKRDNREYELWSETDGFFYDVLTYPDGRFAKFRVRSLVGIIPLFAIDVLTEEELDHFPEFKNSFTWFLKNRASFTKNCAFPVVKNNKTSYVLTLVDEDHLKSVLRYVWDPEEFRSSFGLRSLSKFHEKNPFFYKEKQIGYEPRESLDRIKGGNSNWRGPIWIPMTYMLVQSLKQFSIAFQGDVTISNGVEPAVGLDAMARVFANGIISIFSTNQAGVRPFFGASPLAKDPFFCNYLLFYEYYHGDTGEGLGASHQTGWSGLVANLIHEFKQ